MDLGIKEKLIFTGTGGALATVIGLGFPAVHYENTRIHPAEAAVECAESLPANEGADISVVETPKCDPSDIVQIHGVNKDGNPLPAEQRWVVENKRLKLGTFQPVASRVVIEAAARAHLEEVKAARDETVRTWRIGGAVGTVAVAAAIFGGLVYLANRRGPKNRRD
ncbi:MAG: hypothetical protein JWL85_103 [Candidatus Saccharibacteria bacterium]|nr:hypothetical protein [Candidatus Saccharibacteria bacterium]